MSKRVYVGFFLMFVLIFAQVPYIPIERHGSEVIEPQGPGEINWTQQVIKAKGWGIIDTTLPRPQAKAMAIRAATVVAQRNLLEIIKGVRVTSETKVQDLMTRVDYIYTRLDGVVKGARMVGDPIEKDGMIEVELAVGIYDSSGVAPTVIDAVRQKVARIATLSAQDRLKIEKITGLVIDATGTNVQPAIFPRVLDKQGNVLFDPAEYYDSNDPELRKLVKILTTAEKEIKKAEIGKNPYIIKAFKAIHSDLVVDDENAKKVNWLKRTFRSLLKIGKAL